MSLWSRFKKELGNTYDHLNVLDGGKSYANKKVTPASGGGVRDIFDANTQRDIAKRVAVGQPAGYREQQIAMGNKRPYQNLGAMLAGSTARFINTGIAAAQEVDDTAKLYSADWRNDDEDWANTNKRIISRQKKQYQPNSGLFGQGTIFDNPEEFNTLGSKDIAKRVAFTTAGTALEITPFAKGGAAVKAGNAAFEANIAAKAAKIAPTAENYVKAAQLANKAKEAQLAVKAAQIANPVARTAARVGSNMAQGAGSDIAEQQITRDHYSPMQTAQAAVTGGIFPETVKVTGKVFGAGKNKIMKMLDDRALEAAEKNTNKGIPSWLQPPITKPTNKIVDTPVDIARNNAINDKANQVLEETRGRPKVVVMEDPNNVGQRGGSVPDKSNPTVRVQPDGSPMPIQQPNSTTSLGSSMPDLQARMANPTSVTRAQAEDIAAKVGGKADDVERNINKYGYERTNQMYTNKNDAMRYDPETGKGIENIDAVVSAELRKQKGTVKVVPENHNPKMSPEEEQALFASAPPTVKVTPPVEQPTVKVVNPEAPSRVQVGDNIVDTNTGEIINQRTPATNIKEFTTNLPDPKATTRAEADELIGEGTDWLRRAGETIDEALKAKGDSYENFSRAIQEANRNGTTPPKEYADLYNKYIKPALDDFRTASGRETGEQEWYLPQYKADDVAVPVTKGHSLVNSIDVEDFGSAHVRENKIPLDEMDHSPNALGRYGTQTMSERYRHSMAVDDLIQQADKRGVKLSQEEASHIVTSQDELAKEIADAAQHGGIVNSGMDKMDIVEKISKLGDAKGKEKFVLDKGLSRVKRLVSGSDELYDIPYGGSGKTVGETMGFERFTEARGQGVRLEKEIADNGLNPTEHLTERYSEVPIDDTVKQSIIERTQKRIDRINELAGQMDAEGNPKFSDEEILARKQDAYRAAERNVAREQTVEFLENTKIEDPQLRKNINQDAKRILVQDKANQSFAHTLVNGFTGIKHVGLLGYNLMSAMFNGIETKRIFAKYGAKEYAQAMKQAVLDSGIAERYGVVETRVGDILQESGKEANPKLWKPMGLFQESEAFKDAALLHAAENHYKAQGLEGEELFRAVYKDFNKYGIKYGQIGSLGYNKSKTGRLLGQFMQYPIKDWTIRVNEAVKAFGGKNATAAEKRAAQKYLARDIPATAAIYLGLSAALGTGWEQVVGINNPIQSSPLPKDAEWDEKIVSKLPGGPFVQDTKDLYLAIREAYRTKEEGEDVGISDVVNNELKKDAASYIPGGQQILNRTGGFIADQMRGYDENSKGRARYEASDDPINIIKGVLFGGYTTDNAREYYGNKGVAGDLPGRGGDTLRPVNQRYQDQINQGTDVGDVISKSRESQARAKKFYDTPQGKAWEGLYTTTYNPDTKKNETDVISPEKWKGVQSDKSGKTYTQLQEAAKQRNKDFGDPLDPVYSDKWSKYKNDILTMRSQFTGDDTEMKDIANATKPWYKDYMKDYIAYINQMKDTKYTEDENYGTSQRSKDYYDLTTKNPSIPDNAKASYPLINQYFDVKGKNPEAGKQFFKDHVDKLSADFKQQKIDKWNWTNKMRALEGAPPIDWNTFQNVTFGYEDDERKVAQELYWKFKDSNSRGGGGIRISKGDFGEVKSVPKPSVSKVKSGTIKVVSRTPRKIKMVRNKA